MHPALLFSALALAGALVGLSTSPGPWPLALAAATVCGVLAFVRASPSARVALLLLVVFLLALSSAWHARARFAAATALVPHGAEVEVVGVVLERAYARSGAVRLALSAESIDDAPARVHLDVWLRGVATRAPARAGDRVRVWGRARRPAPALRPGAFDDERYAFARGRHGAVSVRWADDVEVLVAGERSAVLARARSRLRARMLELLPPREAGVVLALIVGDTSLFDDDQLALYRRVGAGHLLAVSGLQVTLLALVLLRLITALFLVARPTWLRTGRAQPLASALAVLGVWLFVGLCGAPPSAVRAGGMATVVLLSLARAGGRARAVDALALWGGGTLLVAPEQLLDPGFALSYAAVIGLLVAERRVRRERPLSRLAAAVAATGGAGVLTLPLSAHLFGQVAPGGLLANLLLVPLASVLQVPAIGLGLLAAVCGSPMIATGAAACAGAIEAVCAALDPILGGLVAVSPPSGAGALALVGAGALAVAGAARGLRPVRLGVACAIATTTLAATTWEPGGVRVTALAVGQGDATVIESPGGAVVLVDGGGVWDERWDPGRDVVLPFLARRGVTRLDVVALSHPDPDHLLGLLSVIEEMEVQELWHPGYGAEHRWMKRLLAVAARRGVRVRAASELLGRERVRDLDVRVLSPAPADGSERYDELSPNDNSLTMLVEYRGERLLLPGDLEEWGEHFLLASGEDVRADVVKAPHHGSRTSSTPAFVRATQPSLVWFSTGRDNRFGFPHEAVRARWRAAGARLLNTAAHGETAIYLTGRGVVVRPFRAAAPP